MKKRKINRSKQCVRNRRKHFALRVEERYGIKLDRKCLAEIERTIKSGNAYLVEILTWSKKLYEIEWNGSKMLVVYSSKHRNVITALPPRS